MSDVWFWLLVGLIAVGFLVAIYAIGGAASELRRADRGLELAESLINDLFGGEK